MNTLLLSSTDNNSNLSGAMEKQGTPAQLVFFRRLHMMISNETHSGCIVWLPDGRGFAIPSKQAFADNILSRYFGKSKFASFTRRLKRWSFTRRGDSYYHSQFKRDMVFDDVEDLDSMLSIKPFQSKGPLKKRFKYRMPSPPPICSSPSSDASKDKSTDDIHIMPELLRVINRKKRDVKNEFPLLSEGKALSRRTEEFLIARALESLQLKVRKTSSPCVKRGDFSQLVPIPYYLAKPKTFSFSRAA